MKRILFCMLLLMTSCAPAPDTGRAELLKLMANRPVTCQKGPDCHAKWEKAIEWVTRHTEYGIRTINDHLISTNVVYDDDRHTGLRASEYTVVRYAHGPQEYEFNFASYCERGFECGDKALVDRAHFVNAVMGLPPGVVQTGRDSYRVKASTIGLETKP